MFHCGYWNFYDGMLLIKDQLSLNWEAAPPSARLTVPVHYNFRSYFRGHETFDRYSFTLELHRLPYFDRTLFITGFILCRVSGSVTSSRFLKR